MARVRKRKTGAKPSCARPNQKRGANGRMQSSYDPAVCKRVPELMAGGLSLQEMAVELGIGRFTFDNWRERHPEFNAAVEEGLWRCEAYWCRIGREISQGDRKCESSAVYIFTMKNRFGWRDQVDLNHKGGLTVRFIVEEA